MNGAVWPVAACGRLCKRKTMDISFSSRVSFCSTVGQTSTASWHHSVAVSPIVLGLGLFCGPLCLSPPVNMTLLPSTCGFRGHPMSIASRALGVRLHMCPPAHIATTVSIAFGNTACQIACMLSYANTHSVAGLNHTLFNTLVLEPPSALLVHFFLFCFESRIFSQLLQPSRLHSWFRLYYESKVVT